VAVGEFGRTPKINDKMGRDHWGACQSAVLAGGGIRGGQVYGSSDKIAAYPKDNPVSPEDFLATIHMPPNPYRNFDNTLPTTLDLSSFESLGRFSRNGGTGLPPGAPLLPGNPVNGLSLYRTRPAHMGCHGHLLRLARKTQDPRPQTRRPRSPPAKRSRRWPSIASSASSPSS